MGAVRKLATVVIVGLVALSTLMVVYLAAEPMRRGDETSEQNTVSIERGTSLYITYCLQCHGPAGLGVAENVEPRRVGGILNQDAVYPEDQQSTLNANFQSDDPVAQGIAEDWIRYRVMYGIPAEQFKQNNTAPVQMPAFRHDLNVEEINNLVYLIMHGDWNYVYNTAVEQTGVNLARQECLATPGADAAACEAITHAEPAYPTPPAPANAETSGTTGDAATPAGGDTPQPPTSSEAAGTPAASDQGATTSGGGGTDAGIEIEAQDSLSFSQSEISLKPGDTITMTNAGFLQHDFTVDELGIHEVTAANGDTVTITIPEDAQPGEYTFYCSVPGHREGGMVGTLTIEAP